MACPRRAGHFSLGDQLSHPQEGLRGARGAEGKTVLASSFGPRRIVCSDTAQPLREKIPYSHREGDVPINNCVLRTLFCKKILPWVIEISQLTSEHTNRSPGVPLGHTVSSEGLPSVIREQPDLGPRPSCGPEMF